MDPRARTRLGRSNVFVDRLLLGLVPLGNMYKVVSDEEAQAVLQTWWDHGLRTYDVAPVYGFGLAERRLGRFLADKLRSEFTVSTKVGRPIRKGAPDDPELYWPDGTPYFHGMPDDIRPYYDFTRDGMLWGFEQSLERLGLDGVDYVHLHDPDDHIPAVIEVAFPTLAEMRSQGIIGAIGVGTNWGRVAYPIALECDLDCVLPAGRYTLVDFEAAEQLLPLCEERGITVINGGVFNGGFLADPKIGATFQYRPTQDQYLVDRALAIKATCAAHGVPIKAAALQFSMGHPAVGAIVIGASSVAHAEEVIRLFEQDIPDAMWDELLASGLLPAGTPVPVLGR